LLWVFAMASLPFFYYQNLYLLIVEHSDIRLTGAVNVPLPNQHTSLGAYM
jgi:hypothetical protein